MIVDQFQAPFQQIHNWHSTAEMTSSNGTIIHGFITYGHDGHYNMWTNIIDVHYIRGTRGRYFVRTNSGKISHEQNRLRIQTNLAKELASASPTMAG